MDAEQFAVVLNGGGEDQLRQKRTEMAKAVCDKSRAVGRKALAGLESDPLCHELPATALRMACPRVG
jgi:hypothetical protein